jgi:hypothetical protein
MHPKPGKEGRLGTSSACPKVGLLRGLGWAGVPARRAHRRPGPGQPCWPPNPATTAAGGSYTQSIPSPGNGGQPAGLDAVCLEPTDARTPHHQHQPPAVGPQPHIRIGGRRHAHPPAAPRGVQLRRSAKTTILIARGPSARPRPPAPRHLPPLYDRRYPWRRGRHQNGASSVAQGSSTGPAGPAPRPGSSSARCQASSTSSRRVTSPLKRSPTSSSGSTPASRHNAVKSASTVCQCTGTVFPRSTRRIVSALAVP